MTFIETNAKWQAHAFVLLYHKGETNHCPGCGGTHWIVGRHTSECARCTTALPIAYQREAESPFEQRRKGWERARD